MENRIQHILEELYHVDGSLRVHEEKLKVMIRELLIARPDIKIDEHFRSLLRTQLATRASEMTISKPSLASSWGWMMHSRGFKYAVGGALVIMLVVTARNSAPIKLSADQEIVSVGREAFGSLAQSGSARSQSGGGGGGGAVPAAAPMGLGSGGDAISGKMIAPYPGTYETYKYVYKGGDFELSANVDVLKRVRGAISGSASSFLRNLGMIDLGTFGQAKMQNVTLVEDKPFGYMISIFFDEGTVSINENWTRWDHPEANCRDEACYQSLRLKVSDVPADDRLIAVADQFLKDHKISREGYGSPEVVNDWRVQYERLADKSQLYIPDAATVIYPLMVDDKYVYEDGGSQKHGLYVTVNVRQMRVSSAGTIAGQKYERSPYAGVTDKQTVLDVVARGGRYGYIDPQARVVEVEVGAPTRAYAKVWSYKDNVSHELLVPALVFPVINPPASMQWYPQNIVVPLAQELLQQDGGPIRILENPMPATQ